MTRETSETDAELSRLFAEAGRGDQAAYRAFLVHAAAKLRPVIRRELSRAGRSDPRDVEDALQETLLAMHLSRHTYDPAAPVGAWLAAIARYKTIDLMRRTGRHAPHGSLDTTEAADAGTIDSTAERLDLERALERLPERTRALITAVKVTGASISDAAAQVGMTEGAAKVAIHRGIQVLAGLLRDRRP